MLFRSGWGPADKVDEDCGRWLFRIPSPIKKIPRRSNPARSQSRYPSSFRNEPPATKRREVFNRSGACLAGPFSKRYKTALVVHVATIPGWFDGMGWLSLSAFGQYAGCGSFPAWCSSSSAGSSAPSCSGPVGRRSACTQGGAQANRGGERG